MNKCVDLVLIRAFFIAIVEKLLCREWCRHTFGDKIWLNSYGQTIAGYAFAIANRVVLNIPTGHINDIYLDYVRKE